MWVLNITIIRNGGVDDKVLCFYTRHAMLDFMSKLVSKDVQVSFSVNWADNVKRKGAEDECI